MKKTALIYGSIIGITLCINFIVQIDRMYKNPSFKGNDILGYAFMIVIFSLIFFGIRNFRNKYQSGLIHFGKAFKIGILITLVASAIYVGVWLFYYYLFVPDFMDVYTAHVLKNADAAELAIKTAEMARFNELYKNPIFVILVTFSEVFPLGLVIALVSALMLQKK